MYRKRILMSKKPNIDEVKTLVVDNFQGSYTLFRKGNINSGRSYEQVTAGQNPFIKPGELTWSESPTQIDPTGSVITDLIVAAKERAEAGVLYVYAIGHTGRLYKIQVNDPTTYNPDYDNPVLLATLSSNSPTFTKGGFMEFFGSTERIFIGHDKGVTRIDFNGANETFVGILGSWTQNVPRPFVQFLGNLYASNGNNLVEIISGATVSTYAKLSPAFPPNTQIRDIDLSPDGTYVECVSSELALFDITSAAQETTSPTNSSSSIYKWNGIDLGATSTVSFPSFSLSANILFQNYQYTFGTDQFGTAVYNPTEKIITFPESPAPLPNAVLSTGNMVMFMVPTYFNGVLETDIFAFGSNDFEVGHPIGFWDLFFTNSTAPETDIVRVPLFMSVSNAGLGASSNNYPNNQFGTSKLYFSTLETSSTPTTKYRFYKLKMVTSTGFQSESALLNAYYQTQTQLFSKKMKIGEVRIYGEPWVANNSFLIDLIGSDGLPISGASKTFTTDGLSPNITIGNDFAWYTPQAGSTYCIGLGITNLGTANHTISKVEIDYTLGGK